MNLPYHHFSRFAQRYLLMALLLTATSCHSYLQDLLDELGDREHRLPQKVSIQQQGLFPEGIAYDAARRQFLVSSLTRGTIGAVDDKGNYTPFVEDDDFVSTIGIEVDELQQRLLVCVSDPNTAGLAALGIYDMDTQDRIAFTDLAAVTDEPNAAHFANDVATDWEGNAYVTDSFYPVIYKVDKDGNASVFFQHETFRPAPGAFGLNGIVYHPAGFLIVAFSQTNTLYKIPLEQPENFSVIALDVELESPDGLLLTKDLETLIVVNNAGGTEAGRVLALESDDWWDTAEADDTFETGAVFPTTATERGGKIYVLYAYLHELFSGNASREEFQIVQAELD